MSDEALGNEFSSLKPDLESELKNILETGVKAGESLYLEENESLDKLCDLGYLTQETKADYTLHASFKISRKAANYFQNKETYFNNLKIQALSKLEISEFDEYILAMLIQLSFESENGLITDGFDAADPDQVAAIRKLSNQGYLKVTYADNVPYFASVTKKGFSYFADDESPQPPSKLAEKIASVIGSFTGSFTRELNGL